LENLKGWDLMGDTGVERRVILRYILKGKDVRIRYGFIWLRIHATSGPLKQCNRREI
jgi:hypothetical protein